MIKIWGRPSYHWSEESQLVISATHSEMFRAATLQPRRGEHQQGQQGRRDRQVTAAPADRGPAEGDSTRLRANPKRNTRHGAGADV
jgi:hypothetical protein